jgi:hypothetical protein
MGNNGSRPAGNSATAATYLAINRRRASRRESIYAPPDLQWQIEASLWYFRSRVTGAAFRLGDQATEFRDAEITER